MRSYSLVANNITLFFRTNVSLKKMKGEKADSHGSVECIKMYNDLPTFFNMNSVLNNLQMQNISVSFI